VTRNAAIDDDDDDGMLFPNICASQHFSNVY